jgi:starvation-inducible DNA-binding protein
MTSKRERHAELVSASIPQNQLPYRWYGQQNGCRIEPGMTALSYEVTVSEAHEGFGKADRPPRTFARSQGRGRARPAIEGLIKRLFPYSTLRHNNLHRFPIVMEFIMSETASSRRKAPLRTPSGLSADATRDISGALSALLADVYALYIKTKNFHWHVSGPHFRDYHLLLDDQAAEILATADPIAERARKLGGTTIRSIGHIARLQRVLDNDADYVDPSDMLAELKEDNEAFAARLRETHDVCDEYGDVATASLIENWIDETEKRVWFLFEAGRRDNK